MTYIHWFFWIGGLLSFLTFLQKEIHSVSWSGVRTQPLYWEQMWFDNILTSWEVLGCFLFYIVLNKNALFYLDQLMNFLDHSYLFRHENALPNLLGCFNGLKLENLAKTHGYIESEPLFLVRERGRVQGEDSQRRWHLSRALKTEQKSPKVEGQGASRLVGTKDFEAEIHSLFTFVSESAFTHWRKSRHLLHKYFFPK